MIDQISECSNRIRAPQGFGIIAAKSPYPNPAIARRPSGGENPEKSPGGRKALLHLTALPKPMEPPTLDIHSYCWWKKSCTSWYGKYPTIYMVLYIPGGCLGILPSTAPPEVVVFRVWSKFAKTQVRWGPRMSDGRMCCYVTSLITSYIGRSISKRIPTRPPFLEWPLV